MVSLHAGLSLLVTCFNAGQYGISSSSGVIDAVYSTLAPILVKACVLNLVDLCDSCFSRTT